MFSLMPTAAPRHCVFYKLRGSLNIAGAPHLPPCPPRFCVTYPYHVSYTLHVCIHSLVCMNGRLIPQRPHHSHFVTPSLYNRPGGPRNLPLPSEPFEIAKPNPNFLIIDASTHEIWRAAQRDATAKKVGTKGQEASPEGVDSPRGDA